MTDTGKSGTVDRLVAARRSHSPLDTLAPNDPADINEAYEIADGVAKALGQPVVGWKIGCTSEFAQQALGIDGPISGRVHARQDSGSHFDLASFTGAQIEGEMAFTMATDLAAADAPFSQADITAAVSTLHPAIEVVGGRMANFMSQPILTTIADSGANAGLILGAPVTDWDPDDLPATPGTMTVDGEQTGAGTGADVLGHPLAALTWLANHLAERGLGLHAGDVVTTGTCTQIAAAVPGATATVSFGVFGTASVTFHDSSISSESPGE